MAESFNEFEPSMQPGRGDEPEGPDLWHYVGVVSKRKWIILATIAVAVTLTVVYTMRQTPIYQATASVVVHPQAPQVFGSQVQEIVQLGSGNQWSNHEYHNTQIDILASYDFAEETVRRHDLHRDPRLLPPGDPAGEDARITRATTILDNAITASVRRDSRIIEVHVKHADRELAADLANAHVETYINANLSIKTKYSEKASKFLARELDAAQKQLRESEQKVADFKRENQILSISLDDKINIVAGDLEKYTAALSNARIKRIELGSVRKQAQEAAKSENVLESPIFALGGSADIKPLKEAYLTEQQKLLEISEELGPRHPDRIAQQKKIDDIYAGIQREARLAMREIDDRYQAALASESKFQAEVDRLTKEALELDAKKVAYNRLSRAEQSDTENFNIVRGRLRDSQLSGRNQLGNIEPHTTARVPGAPVHPRMQLNVAIAAVVSLLLGLGLAFGLEYLDRTIGSVEDVEQRIGVPLLGVIPDIDDIPAGAAPADLRERDLYVFNHPTSRAAECARSIRTNILFSGADRELKVLTLSSPNPREGKTTSVVYLGTTMAQSGQRVLLIDTDMRRPRLHKTVGVPRGLGVSNLILGESSYEDVIKTTDIPNLYVMPCGPTPPNPAELLLTQRFKEIIEELRGKFDRIILDSPPLQAVTDAVVLSQLSDGVILVAKAGKTLRDELSKANKSLRQVNANTVGVILNDLDLNDRKYGYYQYTYGYGEAPDAAEAESKG